MKKIVFIFVCVLSLGILSVYASDSVSSNNDTPPACTSAGNVSAEVKTSTVYFVNYNSYMVTVSYQVYGHRSNGSRSRVDGGTVVLNAGGSASRSYTKTDNYTSYSVEIQPQQCK